MKLRSVLERLLATFVTIILSSLTLLVVVAVVFRKAGASLSWYDETASILLAWLTFYGAALVALDRGHIAVTGLTDRLPRPVRTAAFLLAELAVILFCLGLATAGVQLVHVVGDTSMVSLPWVPSAVTHSVIPVGATLYLVAEISGITAGLRRLQRSGR